MYSFNYTLNLSARLKHKDCCEICCPDSEVTEDAILTF
jgi:hypothetical protein